MALLKSLGRWGLLCLVLGLSGCGGTGPASGTPPPASGLLSVRLAGGPGEGLRALRVQVAKVEVEGPTGWIPFATATKAVDLVALAGGATETLSETTGPLLTGAFSRVRVTFGSEASVTYADGRQAALVAPSAVIVDAPLTFPGTQQGLTLVLDPGRSLQHWEGTPLLRPALQVLRSDQLGRVQGRLTAGGQGLEGVVVSAQTFPQLGVPQILQRVVTDSDGSYSMGLLPRGVPLHVLSQPVTATASFDPQASPLLTLGEAVQDWQATFTSRPNLASFSGVFLPTATSSQSGEVQLLGPVQAGTEVKLFALRTVPSVLQGGAETHRMGLIPAGSYVLRAYRSTWRGDGTSLLQGQNSVDLGLVPDFETQVDFLW